MPDPLTPQALRALMERATPGPWHIGGKEGVPIVYGPDGFAVADATVFHGTFKEGETEANAALIVAAVNSLPALLARIEELEKGLGDAGEAIRELRLADGHANRTGDEARFDRALAAVCQHEGRARSLLAGDGE